LISHLFSDDATLNPANDLLRGMFDDTDPTNFTANVGGWNCRHQLYPVPEYLVPEDVRKKLEEKNTLQQKEGIIKPKKDTSGMLYFDPLGIKTLYDLTTNMVKKVAPSIRKAGLENYLKHNEHETEVFKTKRGIKTNIWTVKGADYEDFEYEVAKKLAKSGQHILIPNRGGFESGRRNDVFMYDAKTYMQQKVELKSLFGSSYEAVKSNMISGSGQSNIIAYDIQSNIKLHWLVDGLRHGWGKNLKSVMINYNGQWYQFNKNEVHGNMIYDTLR